MAESYSVKAVLSAVDKNFSSTFSSAQKSISGISDGVNKATGAIGRIAAGIGVFKALSAGANLLSSSVSSAFSRQDTMEQFNRTITTITGNANAASGALEELKGITKGTAYGLDAAAKATQNFVTRGMSLESATKSVGAWADAVAFYGKGTNEQLEMVADAIGKMRTKGTVEMDQLNRLFDVGIDAVGMYAKAVGRDSASVQDDLSKGKIRADEFLSTVETAMMEGTNGVQKISGAAKEAGASWSGTFDNMRAAVTRGTLSIINAVDEMLKKNGFSTMRESIKKFGDTAESVLNKVADGIKNLSNVGDVFSRLGKTFAKTGAIKALSKAFQNVGKAVQHIITSLESTGVFDQIVKAFGNIVKAKKVIVATGYNTKLFTNRNFATKTTTFNIATKPVKNFDGWYEKVLIRDNCDPYNYLRTTSDNRIIIGGEDVDFVPDIFDEKLANKKYDILENRLKNMFKNIKDIEVDYKYCGTFASTLDNLGFIGEDTKHNNLWYNLGYGANGILFAILGGMMLSKLYHGEKDKDMRLFKVDRFDN